MQEGRGAAVETGRSRPLLALTAAAVVVADQASKALALRALDDGERVRLLGGVLGLRVTGNPGGAFGILPEAPLFFFGTSLAIVVVVLYWGWRSGEAPLPLGMVAGGGLGNLVDRVFRPPGPFYGHVVDFIDLSFWPTFNVADSAIVLGIGWLVLAGLRSGRE